MPEDPELHVDLLELGCLCLSLGYEGKYRGKSKELTQFIDKLYDLIRNERGGFSKQLFVASPAPIPEKK